MQLQRLTLGALALSVAVAGCGGAKQAGPMALNVDVAAAVRQNIATTISLQGQVAPLEQSTLAFQQSGPITAVYVNVGDRVSAGQVLAKIDPSTLVAQLAQAQAQANQSSATARGAVVGLPSQQQTNNAALSTAKAALTNAQLAYTQDQQLFKQGYVSQSALVQAQAMFVQARDAYNNARIGLTNNQVSEENVKASQAAADAAAANANTLRTEIGQTTIYAPFDGVITQRLMDPGSMAGPAQPVVAISRLAQVWVNINVPDVDLAYVHAGEKVAFTSKSLPGKTFTGAIGSVNAVPTQGTLSYLARITMANPDDILKGGTLVDATLPKEQAMNAIVVPLSAIAQTATGSAVYVVKDDKAEEVPVKLGVQTDTMAQVMSPKVQPGTNVITTRPDALQDQSVVAVNGKTK